MNRTIALLRRHATTLLLVGIAIAATVAVAQTARLRYLEARHQQMLRDFGKARVDMQITIGDLAARCPAATR